MAGEANHEFVIERTIPFGAPTTVQPSPFPVDEVALSVVTESGDAWPLEARPDSPAVFVARGEVTPRSTYRLTGRVSGFDVRAEVTVPSVLDVEEPGEDTVTVGLGDTLRLRVTATGALGILVFAGRTGPGFGGFGSLVTRDGEVDFFLGEATGFAPGSQLQIDMLALDSVSTRYVESRPDGFASPDAMILPSNIEGGATGLFGGATAARRHVIVQ